MLQSGLIKCAKLKKKMHCTTMEKKWKTQVPVHLHTSPKKWKTQVPVHLHTSPKKWKTQVPVHLHTSPKNEKHRYLFICTPHQKMKNTGTCSFARLTKKWKTQVPVHLHTSPKKWKNTGTCSFAHLTKKMKNIGTCSFAHLTKYYSRDQIRKNEMGEARDMYGRQERCTQGFGGGTWGKEAPCKTQD